MSLEFAASLVEHFRLQVEELEPAGRNPSRDLHAEVSGPWSEFENVTIWLQRQAVSQTRGTQNETANRIVDQPRELVREVPTTKRAAEHSAPFSVSVFDPRSVMSLKSRHRVDDGQAHARDASTSNATRCVARRKEKESPGDDRGAIVRPLLRLREARVTLDEYQRAAARTLNQRLDHDQQLFDAAAGIAEEAGEVLAHVRKHVYQGRGLDRERVAEELGDVLWCVAAVATVCGLELSAIARQNQEKLTVRHPPS